MLETGANYMTASFSNIVINKLFGIFLLKLVLKINLQIFVLFLLMSVCSINLFKQKYSWRIRQNVWTFFNREKKTISWDDLFHLKNYCNKKNCHKWNYEPPSFLESIVESFFLNLTFQNDSM